MTKKRPVKGENRGKHPIWLNKIKISSTVYIDYEGQFIIVKGERIKVKECKSGFLAIY